MIKYIFILSSILCGIVNVLFAQVQNREHYIHQPTFENTMSGILDGNVKGYQYTVGDENGVLFTEVFGDRRSATDNGGTAASWTSSNKMIGASTAKMVCAVAIMNILESTAISGAPTLDDKLDILLQDYIPIRWRALINGNEDQITLRHLMNHQSGIYAGIGGSGSRNPKPALAATMNNALPAPYLYKNVNFDLAGIMIIYLAYPVTMSNLEAILANSTDASYDAAMEANMMSLYEDYVQNNIFQPAGINVSCGLYAANPSAAEVYQYSSESDENGFHIGDVPTCMSNGWIWSTADMTRFIQKWTNPQLPGNILTAASVSRINDFPNSATTTPLGWNRNQDTDIGEGYGHGGGWWLNGNQYNSSMMLTEDNVIMNIHVNCASTVPNNTNHAANMRVAYNDAVCAPNIILTESIMKKYNSAGNTITTFLTTTADNSETNVFKAGQRITLNPGFRAVPGSVFRAYIDTCDNLPTE